MSVSTQISRITANRNTIRAKLVELGLTTSSATLDTLANVIENITNQGAISATVKEGETYTIPAGWHSGSGTVSGVAGGGDYDLQSKNVTPTKLQQSVTADSGYYGLSDVTVAPIPDTYQDVTSVTAEAGDVLTGKIYVTSDGTVVTGTMINNGAVKGTVDCVSVTYTIPKGYHNGTGTVTITLEEKTVTPTKSTQTVTPTTGKVLSKVTVGPIPDEYITTDDATATAENIIEGKTAYVNGEKVTGTIPINGTDEIELNGSSVNIKAGYYEYDCGKAILKGEVKTPMVSVSSDGVITATVTQSEGYIDEATQTATKQLDTQGAKSIVPTKSSQVAVESGKYTTGDITVEAIPDAYQDVTSVDATAADVLATKKIVSATGEVVEGTMPNNGAIAATIDGLTTTSYTVPTGYTSGGTVSLTSDIEEALAAI